MKPILFVCCILVALGAVAARAGIVLEEAPQDSAPVTNGKPITVPKPDGATTTATDKPASSDILHFANRDSLHGSFLAFDKSGVHWQSLESKDPIIFQTSNLSEVKLDSHRPPANAAPANQAVTLTNNDELPGTLVSMDDKTLVMDTWYAGKITIPRVMVRGITPLKGGGGTFYEGPTGMDGWILGNNGNRTKSWTYRDGALISTSFGTIGRDMKLPDVASIAFDLVSRGNQSLQIGFYSDQAEAFSNCYLLQMNNNYIYLQRYSRNGGNGMVNMMDQQQPVMLRGAALAGKMHMDIRVNKATKSIWLFVDGKMVKQWTDPGDFAGTGTKVIFSSQQGMYARISNIKVSAWDGKLDESSGADDKSKEDSIKMANSDKVSGKLKKIEDGKVIFASSYADLTIPLDRIEQIDMSTQGADKPKQNPNDVRAYFADRGSVTMQLQSWDGKQVTASSPNFGTAVFSPDAFQRLMFNLGQQAASTDDTAIDAGGPDDEDMMWR